MLLGVAKISKLYGNWFAAGDEMFLAKFGTGQLFFEPQSEQWPSIIKTVLFIEMQPLHTNSIIYESKPALFPSSYLPDFRHPQ